MTTETNWEEIAMQLGQRVNFAVSYLDCKGSGGLFNAETGDIKDWRIYMAEGLEMIPGVKVDREILATMHLPRAQRKKAQKAILEKRAVERNKT